MVEHSTQDAIIRRLVTEPALLALLERVGGRGRRGTAALRAVVRSALPDERIQSMLEQRLLELLVGLGLRPPAVQHELRCADGREVRLDFAWPERRMAIEVDGLRWHGTAARFRKDLARSRSIQATGWAHHRYGWHDLHDDLPSTRLELCRVVRP